MKIHGFAHRAFWFEQRLIIKTVRNPYINFTKFVPKRFHIIYSCYLWLAMIEVTHNEIKRNRNWNVIACVAAVRVTISFPESSFPLTSGRKTRVLGATISGMRHRCRLRSETGWAESPEFGYFKMVAPRALVFRLLVKGNENSGKEIGRVSRRVIKSGGLLATRHF